MYQLEDIDRPDSEKTPGHSLAEGRPCSRHFLSNTDLADQRCYEAWEDEEYCGVSGRRTHFLEGSKL